MRSAAVVGSGPLIALFDRDDAHHEPVKKFLAGHPRLHEVYRDARGRLLRNLLTA